MLSLSISSQSRDSLSPAARGKDCEKTPENFFSLIITSRHQLLLKSRTQHDDKVFEEEVIIACFGEDAYKRLVVVIVVGDWHQDECEKKLRDKRDFLSSGFTLRLCVWVYECVIRLDVPPPTILPKTEKSQSLFSPFAPNFILFSSANLLLVLTFPFRPKWKKFQSISSPKMWTREFRSSFSISFFNLFLFEDTRTSPGGRQEVSSKSSWYHVSLVSQSFCS